MLAAICVVLVSACASTSSSAIKITNSPVPSLKTVDGSSFDALEVDQKAHRLYAADRTDSGVDVFDVSKVPAQYLNTIPMQASPNGLALAPNLGRLFVGLGDGSVGAVDTATGTLVGKWPTTGKTVDLIDYAADRHTVYASNAEEGTVAAIDVQAGTQTMKFNLGGYSLEQPRYNPGDHLLYVTSPTALAIFQIDPNTNAIKKIPTGGCKGSGMAIEPKHNQAVVDCDTYVMRINLHNPEDASGFTQIPGGDLVSYDAAVNRFFVSNPITSEVGVFGGNPIDYIGSVKTGGFGNSATYDETNGMVYSPDGMRGRAGIDGFKMPSGEIWIVDISPATWAAVAILLAAFVAIMFILGRLADPIHRPVPQPAPARPRSRDQNPGVIRPGARSWTKKT